MKNRHLQLFLLISLMFIPNLSARAQSGIAVSDEQTSIGFPETITFSAEVQAAAGIASVILEYGVRQLTCGEVVGKAFPEFVAGTSSRVEWTWDMRQSGSEPPGAVIWWQWHIIDASGGEYTSPRQTVTWLDDVHDWQTISGGNINLHWYRGDQAFGQDLHQTAVDALERLADEVGIMPPQPIDLYIYGNTTDMRDAILYEPSWTGGMAFSENSVVIIGISQNDLEWGKLTEAHELTHVLVGHLTFSCLGFLPTWLSEGLAMYGEGGLDATDQSRLEAAIASDELMSLRSLSGGFSEEYERASLSYAESYSVVKFLLEAYGQDAMSALLAALRDGATPEDALVDIYGFDVDGLEDAWREAIGAAPRIQVSDPTPLPTPSIVPTFVPVSGLPGGASTPVPIPTAQATPGASSSASAPSPVLPAAQDDSRRIALIAGLACCLASLALAIGIIVVIVRRQRRNA